MDKGDGEFLGLPALPQSSTSPPLQTCQHDLDQHDLGQHDLGQHGLGQYDLGQHDHHNDGEDGWREKSTCLRKLLSTAMEALRLDFF